ncbi:MAG: hypothetical protein A2Y10_01555 [Planctomycetes bacterium GWF2_41_51]|nr:MAG: hypothetical protein A2Y10_01555 [Planctomycetes bacterium GWF2_41_51]HBG25470.1 hypothetical protein [Phycisphaerales bacterium]
MRKCVTFIWAFVLIAMLQSAALATYLPESSLWQGGRYYSQNNVSAYVEYAVYDTQSGNYPDGFVNPGSGRYVYAYQIFNIGSTALAPIATFELMGGNASAANGIGYQDDGQGGLAANNDGSSFIWTFTNGLFVSSEHSAFLVFSSDSGPIAGSFSLSTQYGDAPPVNQSSTEIPEPASVSMLCLGICCFLRKKK